MARYREIFCVCGGWAVLFSLAVLLPGCVTRSQAKAQAEAAYLAGQRAAFRQMAARQHAGIQVFGAVEHSEVKWTKGLTLAQAILKAKYVGAGNPSDILLTRQGHTIRIALQQLLAGHDVPLEPGDIITVQQ